MTEAKATFHSVYTGVHGGPCPVCGRCGELHAHHGSYGPEGMRTIVHFDEETGIHEHSLPTADGTLLVDSAGKWTYKPNEEE